MEIDELWKVLDNYKYIKVEDIPNIDLYMDQVTTFMDKRLRSATRNPDEDKVLTKTMINNYAKNNLLPSPEKKKYSKEHMLLLIFIFYFKNILSISDIQTLLQPMTEKYFKDDESFNLRDVYTEVFSLSKAEIESIRKDVKEKYNMAGNTFKDVPKEDQEFLQQFSLICLLACDVFIKKAMIESMIDDMRKQEEPQKHGNEKKEAKTKNKPEKD
ncbi:MAG: DUF1836 domain-containing protein [Lachnospiraceae bacterium]